MQNKIVPKIYEIDYDFIIKNYLDQSQWNKTWTLLVYKQFTFTLIMTNIDVQDNAVYFQLKLTHPSYTTKTDTISYHIDKSNIDMLKKSIEGTILRLIKWQELAAIAMLDEYKAAYEKMEIEREELIKIAKDYLADCEITNRSIIHNYSDDFMNGNEKIRELRTRFYNSKLYTLFTDLYLTYADIYSNESLKELVNNTLHSTDSLKTLLEIDSYFATVGTDSWVEEMKQRLEKI